MEVTLMSSFDYKNKNVPTRGPKKRSKSKILSSKIKVSDLLDLVHTWDI